MAQGGSGKIILLSFSGNTLITIAKFISFMITASPSMFAESIHSLGDSFNQFLLYIGTRKGRLGPCHRYPMGQGRAMYLFNLFAALGIIIGGIYTLYHGFHIVFSEHSSKPIVLNYPTFIILGISFIVESWIFYKAYEGIKHELIDKSLLQFLRESDDPSILGVLFEDGVAIVGVIFAVIGIFLSYHFQTIIPDAIATILIGGMLLFMGCVLFKINYTLIVGSPLPKNQLDAISTFIKSQIEVDKIIGITSEVLAPSRARLSLEIEFHGRRIGNHNQLRRSLAKLREHDRHAETVINVRDRSIRNLGSAINVLEKKIQSEFPNIVIIDIEPN